MSQSIEELTDLIAEMPGIGPRQARRIVQFVLRADASYRNKLSKKIQDIANHLTSCVQCLRFDEISSEKLCSLCKDANRDTSLLMVVEKDVDIESVEQAHIFKGRYFVLGGLMSLARQRKNSAKMQTDALERRLKGDTQINEVILAFATTPEGDYTAKELASRLKELFPQLRVSMLGRGLSLGAEIEYADQETLKNAFQGRH